MEEELVKTKGEARRDRLAYKSLLNEKLLVLVNSYEKRNNADNAVQMQLQAMKHRVDNLEEENKIANGIYKGRLKRLHDEFSKQYIKFRELQVKYDEKVGQVGNHSL